MSDNTTLQIRISSENKEKINKLSKEKGYKTITEYIIDMCCNDNLQLCNDNDTFDSRNYNDKTCNDDYLRLYYDLLPKYNNLKYLLNERISLFDDNFDSWELGRFLWNVDFIEKFKKHYSSEWKNDNTFIALLAQLKKVYHFAYDAEQKNSISVRGYIEKSLGDEYRAIPKDYDLIEKDV